ncbi:MAG: twin-arginine translocation signal domain-containing protein [Candidatus Micrarchaeota archaeon]
MRKQIHHADSPVGLSRRDFLRAGAAGLAALAAGGCGAALRSTPASSAYSRHDDFHGRYPASFRPEYGNLRQSRMVRLAGMEVPVLFLDKTLAELDASSRELRRHSETPDGKSGEILTLRRVRLRSPDADTLVGDRLRELTASMLKQDDGLDWTPENGAMAPLGDVSAGYAIEGGTHSLGLFFPPLLDFPGSGGTPGMRLFDAAAFPEIVSSVAGRELRRLLAVVERRPSHMNFHFLAADESGNPLQRHIGGYLACGITFYPRSLGLRAGPGLLIERGGRDPVDGRPVLP